MKYTGNYNLKKPDGTDVVNIEDLNENADIIDAELKKLNDVIKDLDADGITLPDGKTISEKFEEITEEVGNIQELNTDEKANIVAAINEINQALVAHKAETVHQEGGVHGLVYEEGEWTPYYDSLVGQFEKIDYAQQDGYYLRIGNKVFISMRIATNDVALGTASNTLVIKGLPFVPKKNTYIGLSLEFIERFGNEKSINNIGIANNFIFLANRTTTRTTMLTANDLNEEVGSYQNRIGLSGTYII